MLSTKIIRFPTKTTNAKLSTRTTTRSRQIPNVVVVDTVRTPFLLSNTNYNDLMAVDLQKHAFKELIKRTEINPKVIGHIASGQVVQECRTSNIAKEASLLANFPENIPCSTVVLGCISSNLSINQITTLIECGQIEAGVAGGVELLSDYPIRYNRKVRSAMIQFQRAKSLQERAKLGISMAKNWFNPDLPSVVEYTTNETMGSSADRLAAAFQISRKEQDEFSIRSNTLADKAQKNNLLTDVAPIFVSKSTIPFDNGIRPNTTMQKLSNLKPSFIKPHGTITAGNSSFLTDGAGATLLTSEEYALKQDIKPKAYIRDTIFVAQDPKDQCLLGPAYVIPQILDKAGLKLQDIDVFEIHEAFAGQILANIKAMESDWFCQNQMKRHEKYGTLPMDKVNLWGGSLSLGHPFGATGVRLLAHASNRLQKEGGRYAVIASCAAGGHGVGMLLEAYS